MPCHLPRIHCPRRRAGLGAHLVADVAYGLDELSDGTQLTSYAAHVNIDGARATRVLIPPGALEQRLAREHAAAMLREKAQQLEFLVREIDATSRDLRLVAGDVDHEVVDLDHLVGSERRRFPVELTHACIELGR